MGARAAGPPLIATLAAFAPLQTPVAGQVPGPGPGTSLGLEIDGESLRLTTAEASHLAGGVRELIESCNFNSRDEARFFPGPRVGATDRLVVAYPESVRIETIGGAFEVTEIEIELTERFPGQPATRGPNGPVRFTKCSGGLLLDLVCAGSAPEVLRRRYREACKVLEGAGREPSGGTSGRLEQEPPQSGAAGLAAAQDVAVARRFDGQRFGREGREMLRAGAGG